MTSKNFCCSAVGKILATMDHLTSRWCLQYFHKQRNCRSAPSKNATVHICERGESPLVHLEIASCASKAVPSTECTTMQREPRAGSAKLPNYKIAWWRVYPGYRSSEVIMRLRGANKMRSISHYYLLCFVFFFFLWCGAQHVLPFKFFKTNMTYKMFLINF